MARCEVVEVEQESFGRFLARTREKKGLSQRKLARLTGFSHGYISQLEGGKVKRVLQKCYQPQPSSTILTNHLTDMLL